MATRLKTVCFPLPNLASITDAVAANFTQITVDLPENSKSFKKVWVDAMALDLTTVTGNTVTEWRLSAQLGASGYTTVINTNDIVLSGENMAPFISAEFTTLFTNSWSGTSMTFDLQIYLDQTGGTTFNFRSGSALLWVTYEYDDTTTTQVMNAWIPMTSAVGALPTSKSTAQDTVPALDTFLGYGSISYKHIMMIMEGNEANTASGVTDFVVSVQLDTTTQQNGDTHEAALASDRYVKEHFNLMSGGSPIFTTNATHSFYAWISTGAVGRMNHAAFTMLVVFTFDSTSANSGNISLLLPQAFECPMGGTTSSDYQKGNRELWIEEPATVTTQKSAFRLYWSQIDAIAGLNARAGTQAFVAYTDTATTMCGGNCLQKTCNDNITLARGRNSLSFDVYRTDATDKGWNLSGLWILNYLCGKPTDGWGAANHSVMWNIDVIGATANQAASNERTLAATAPVIPETNYFITGLGIQLQITSSGTTALYSYSFFAERLSAEGGVQWERVYSNPTHDDAEAGLRTGYAQMRYFFKRWYGDADAERVDIETSRRWRLYSGQNTTAYWTSTIMLSYHTITKTVSGTVTGSGGGTVYLYLHRADDNTASAGEKLLTTSRSGNGAFSFTWYDDTEDVYVDGYEDATHMGRSDDGVGT